MIFGLGRGKIEISLEKFNFSPGETIKGKVSLELKKPIRARELKVTFSGFKTTTRQMITSQGAPSTETRKEFIHHFDMPLDGEKEYQKGEYPFEIKVPGDILQRISIPKEVSESGLGAVFKAAEILSSMTGITTRIDWYLEASLEIPKAFDIKKKITINIG